MSVNTYSFLQFDKDDFNYVLEPFNRDCVIHMIANTEFLVSTDTVFKLNNLNSQLIHLIAIAMDTKNDLFKYDFASLLIDSYHRFCILTEISCNESSLFRNNLLNAIKFDAHIQILYQYLSHEEYDTDAIIEDVNDAHSNILVQHCTRNVKDIIIEHIYSETIKRLYQLQYQMYGQLYWKETATRKKNNKLQIKRRKIVSNVKNQLETAYGILGEKQKTKGRILLINGKVMLQDYGVKDLHKLAIDDYNDILFQFMSSNGFYWSLVKQKDLSFFRSAFTNYADEICASLSLTNMNKINDNIFVFWVYIWTISKVIKSYIECNNVSVPLQVDLVIIPNSTINTDNSIGNASLFERFKIHDQSYQHRFCDPNKILTIDKAFENVLRNCTKHQDNNRRVVIIVDRRVREEYRKNSEQFDHIFAYKPPIKYAQINSKHEIVNSIWNTSKFVIPPVSTKFEYEELSGVKRNNLFVLSFLIRKKSRFIHLFEQEEFHINADENKLDDFESFSSEDSESDIQNTTFSSQSAQDFADMLNKQLTMLELVRLFEKVADASFGNQNEFKELQTIQAFILKLLMNRKRDCVVNTYLFYNKGYCRFEPLDLVRMIPHFFNLQKINNFIEMINVFQTYHAKLWCLDDLIWMEYKRLYLQSANAMNQKIVTDTLGTNDQDRVKINNYCKWKKIKQTFVKDRLKKMDSDKIIKLYKMMKLSSQKSLDLFRVTKRENYKIEIRSTIDLRLFLVLSQTHNRKGIKIKQIKKNDTGSLFKETGIKVGWYVNTINDENVENILFNETMDEIAELKETYTAKFIKVKQKKKDKNNSDTQNTKKKDKFHRKKYSNLLPSKARKRSELKNRHHNSIQMSSTILNVSLDELNEPHKLAKWIKSLPTYCKIYNKIKNIHNCKLLSDFLYQIQYCGTHLKYDFNENDFKDLLEAMYNGNFYDYDEYRWIWGKIIAAKRNTVAEQNGFISNHDSNLNWIHNEWTRFQIVTENQYDYDNNINVPTST